MSLSDKIYDHEAIRAGYPDITEFTIIDGKGIFDKNNEPIAHLFEQSRIDAVRVDLNKDLYKARRVLGEDPGPDSIRYPDLGDQLDDLYHKGIFSAEMTATIKAVKDKFPKP